jgi:predicted branched-subunit amino acid permease
MKKLFNHPTFFLWTLLLLTAFLFGRKSWSEWVPRAGTAFGRLVENPTLAGTEVLLALLLILSARFSRSKPNWATVVIAIVAIAFALYHLWNYLIGIEFLLMYGASSLIRDHMSKGRANENV